MKLKMIWLVLVCAAPYVAHASYPKVGPMGLEWGMTKEAMESKGVLLKDCYGEGDDPYSIEMCAVASAPESMSFLPFSFVRFRNYRLDSIRFTSQEFTTVEYYLRRSSEDVSLEHSEAEEIYYLIQKVFDATKPSYEYTKRQKEVREDNGVKSSFEFRKGPVTYSVTLTSHRGKDNLSRVSLNAWVDLFEADELDRIERMKQQIKNVLE